MSTNSRFVELSEHEREQMISDFVDELPVLRTKLGLSQDEMASLLDISRQTYSSMETKKRKMSWSLYLSLILLLDNNSLTHDYLRKAGLFPQKIFQNGRVDKADQVMSFLSGLETDDIKSRLDEQAIHAIEAVIMVEYARCNNMSSEAVIKAFEGKRLSQVSNNTVKAKNALKAIRASAEGQ